MIKKKNTPVQMAVNCEEDIPMEEAAVKVPLFMTAARKANKRTCNGLK